MQEKLMELLKNEEFAKKVNSAKTEEEVLELFKSNGLELNSLEELKKLVEAEKQELDPDELDQVSGGGICLFIGFSFDANACFDDGASASDDSTNGVGAMACMLLGIGAGVTSCSLNAGETLLSKKWF